MVIDFFYFAFLATSRNLLIEIVFIERGVSRIAPIGTKCVVVARSLMTSIEATIVFTLNFRFPFDLIRSFPFIELEDFSVEEEKSTQVSESDGRAFLI